MVDDDAGLTVEPEDVNGKDLVLPPEVAVVFEDILRAKGWMGVKEIMDAVPELSREEAEAELAKVASSELVYTVSVNGRTWVFKTEKLGQYIDNQEDIDRANFLTRGL